MNNSYITIIKEKRTALSRKRVPLNQNECTDDFRIGVPFEQNLHIDKFVERIIERLEINNACNMIDINIVTKELKEEVLKCENQYL